MQIPIKWYFLMLLHLEDPLIFCLSKLKSMQREGMLTPEREAFWTSFLLLPFANRYVSLSMARDAASPESWGSSSIPSSSHCSSFDRRGFWASHKALIGKKCPSPWLEAIGSNHSFFSSPNTCWRFFTKPRLNPFLSGPFWNTGVEKASKVDLFLLTSQQW